MSYPPAASTTPNIFFGKDYVYKYSLFFPAGNFTNFKFDLKLFPYNLNAYQTQSFELITDGRKDVNIQLVYGEETQNYTVPIDLNKQMTKISMLPDWLEKSTGRLVDPPLTRIPKGVPIKFLTSFTDTWKRNGQKIEGVPMESVNNVHVSLMMDKVDFTSMKLQDLYFNRPVKDESVMINNLQFKFFTDKDIPYPILTKDEIVLKVEFESID